MQLHPFFNLSGLCFLQQKIQKERVVRIGVPDDTYDKINGNGKRSGYGYEYLQKSQVIPGGTMNM